MLKVSYYNFENTPTPFLKLFGEFLFNFENEKKKEYLEIFEKLTNTKDINGDEMLLLCLGRDLLDNATSLEEIKEEYFGKMV